MSEFFAQTRSGNLVSYTEPDPDTILLEDIVSHLATEFRWNNSRTNPKSVLQHMIEVADACPDDVKPWALMHDASEFIMRDLPKPLKAICPAYRQTEAKLQSVIYAKFCGRPPNDTEKFLIKLADEEMAEREMNNEGQFEFLEIEQVFMDKFKEATDGSHC